MPQESQPLAVAPGDLAAASLPWILCRAERRWGEELGFLQTLLDQNMRLCSTPKFTAEGSATGSGRSPGAEGGA